MFHTPLWFNLRWSSLDGVQHRYSDYSLRWLGFAVQDTSTPYSVFIIIFCCAALLARTSHPVWQTSASLSETEAGWRAGSEWWSGQHGVSVMQLVAPLVVSLSIFAVLVARVSNSRMGLSCIWRMRPGMGAVPCHLHHCGVVWHERSATSKASIKEQLPVLKRGHL